MSLTEPRSVAFATIVVALLATAALVFGGVAGAQENSNNSTQYSLEELKDGGVHPGGPDSQRWLSDYGSATIRHEPVGPFSGDWEYLDRGTTVNADEITLRTVRLAPEDELEGEMTVTVVSWEKGERETVVGNETVDQQAALNQTVYQQDVTLERGYDEATIDLPSSYDRTSEVTVWIEEYSDARWRFQHRSLPSAEAIDISSIGEAQNYAFQNVTLPGGLAILLGLFGALKTRNRTGSGPGWPLIVWLIAGGILTLGIFSAAYFQVAVVLRYFPWMLAFPLFILAYGGGLAMAGSPSKIQFEKPELFEAQIGPEDQEIVTAALPEGTEDDDDPEIVPDGGVLQNGNAMAENGASTDSRDNEDAPGSGLSDIKEIRYCDMKEVPAIEAPDGTIRVPKRGIRPFLARLFADGAELDKSDLTTAIKVRDGRIDEKILVDPEADEPVVHKPAHLERRWPVLHGINDDDEDSMGKLTGIIGFLAVCVGLPAAGWVAGAEAGVPVLGAALGAVPALIDTYTAKEGKIDFEPANEHFRRARATLVDLQREQADGKTLKSYRDMAWRERARTAEEAIEFGEERDRTLSSELLSGYTGLDFVDTDGIDEESRFEGGERADE